MHLRDLFSPSFKVYAYAEEDYDNTLYVIADFRARSVKEAMRLLRNLRREFQEYMKEEDKRDKEVFTNGFEDVQALRIMRLMLKLYYMFVAEAMSILGCWIFTNPIYDSEYERTLRFCERIKRIIEYILRAPGESVFGEAIRVLKNNLLSNMEKILDILKSNYFDTKLAMDYALTKGERRFINKLILKVLHEEKLNVYVILRITLLSVGEDGRYETWDIDILRCPSPYYDRSRMYPNLPSIFTSGLEDVLEKISDVLDRKKRSFRRTYSYIDDFFSQVEEEIKKGKWEKVRYWW